MPFTGVTVSQISFTGAFLDCAEESSSMVVTEDSDNEMEGKDFFAFLETSFGDRGFSMKLPSLFLFFTLGGEGDVDLGLFNDLLDEVFDVSTASGDILLRDSASFEENWDLESGVSDLDLREYCLSKLWDGEGDKERALLDEKNFDLLKMDTAPWFSLFDLWLNNCESSLLELAWTISLAP